MSAAQDRTAETSNATLPEPVGIPYSLQARALREKLAKQDALVESLKAEVDAVGKERAALYDAITADTRAGLYEGLADRHKACREIDQAWGHKRTLHNMAITDRNQIAKQLQAVLIDDSRIALARLNMASVGLIPPPPVNWQ